VALAFAVFDVTGSASDLGIVLAAHSFVLIALVLVGGVIADRISPRLAMVGADLVRTVAMGLIAALLLSGTVAIWELTLLYAFDGAASAFFNPASNAIVPQIVPAGRLQEANALLNLSLWAGKMAGPAIAGVLLALASPGAALAADALTFAVSAACLMRLRAPRSRDRPRGEPFLRELQHGWRQFSSRDWLVAVVLSAATSNAIFTSAFLVLGPTVAHESLGGSSAWALIAALFGVGGVLGGLFAISIRPRRPLLIAEGFLTLLPLPVLLLAIPAHVATIALGALLAGVAVSFATILYETVAAHSIPQGSLSRVMAYDWFGSLALEPLGLAVVGPLAVGIGISTTLWLGAATMFVCQFCVLLVPGVRRLEWNVVSNDPPPPLIEAGE
jgi:MFS family permease